MLLYCVEQLFNFDVIVAAAAASQFVQQIGPLNWEKTNIHTDTGFYISELMELDKGT